MKCFLPTYANTWVEIVFKSLSGYFSVRLRSPTGYYAHRTDTTLTDRILPSPTGYYAHRTDTTLTERILHYPEKLPTFLKIGVLKPESIKLSNLTTVKITVAEP